jgi:nuclear pore complex protein Nup93
MDSRQSVLYVYSLSPLLSEMLTTYIIEQAAPLLKLDNVHILNPEIFVPTARQAKESDRVLQAIKLYNLAGEYTTVINSLATVLGTMLAGGEHAHAHQ